MFKLIDRVKDFIKDIFSPEERVMTIEVLSLVAALGVTGMFCLYMMFYVSAKVGSGLYGFIH